jgi:uncharacterized protein (DUF2062 family)
LSYHFTRISEGNDIRRNIFRNDTPRAYNRMITDIHSGENDHISSQPDIVADGNRAGVFKAFVPLSGIERMDCRIKATIRTDKNVIA